MNVRLLFFGDAFVNGRGKRDHVSRLSSHFGWLKSLRQNESLLSGICMNFTVRRKIRAGRSNELFLFFFVQIPCNRYGIVTMYASRSKSVSFTNHCASRSLEAKSLLSRIRIKI